MARTSGWLCATRSRFMLQRKWLNRPWIAHGSRCSSAAGWAAPTATELYHAANRSWPSGLAAGVSTRTTFFDLARAWVVGGQQLIRHLHRRFEARGAVSLGGGGEIPHGR